MEMPDFEVRQHRATVIRFENKTWRVASKTTNAGKLHYELARWELADHERPGRQIDYSAEYVAARDQAAPKDRAQNRVTGFFRYVTPLIGFLPARTKARLEMTHGVDPVSATFQSVFLEALITLGSITLAVIGVTLRPAIVIAIVVAVDGSMRYSSILGEERPPPGFYEWMKRLRA
jgi:hypothetical protein